jgi:DNA-binding transcriptional ArsR family regulator
VKAPTKKSKRTGQFSRLPAAAVADPNVSHAALRVLAALGVYVDRDGVCWPATNTLAGLLGVSRAAVQKQIRSLERQGYVTTTRQRRANGGTGPNIYRLKYPGLYDEDGRPRVPSLQAEPEDDPLAPQDFDEEAFL